MTTRKQLKHLGKHFVSIFASLGVLLILAAVPVSQATDTIPEGGNKLAVADTTEPSDVENVKATPGDGSITLSWDVATDNVGVTGYKIYYGPDSLTNQGVKYAVGPVDIGNKITYKVASLTNGKKYYFAVTAYDAAANESVMFSVEQSATPAHMAPDNEPPKVSKAEAVDKNTVRVTFSEALKLPAQTPESAFTIKKDGDNSVLEVKAAIMDSKDATGKAVLLTTLKQQAGASYVLTAGIALKDLAGNPIVSGTSDTASFAGTDVEPVTQQSTQQTQQTSALTVVSAEAVDATHIDVVFSEPVTLKSDARENFIITEEKNIENTVDVLKVELSATKTRVTLTTAPQLNVKYTLLAVDVADSKGKAIDVTKNGVSYAGKGAGSTPSTSQQTTPVNTQQSTQQTTPATPAGDVTPPEEVTNFMAEMVKKMIVTLSWSASLNKAGDLANYILYISTDGSNYSEGITIAKNLMNFDITDLVPKVKYFFKLTSKDAAGNESKGVVTSFMLPATGPEIALFAIVALGAGKWLNRNRSARGRKTHLMSQRKKK